MPTVNFDETLSGMTVHGIIKMLLLRHGYDGLCTDDCGCSIDNLAPCGNDCMLCRPAYKWLCVDCKEDCAYRCVLCFKEEKQNARLH